MGFVVWTGQWFGVCDRQLVPEQADSSDGENHFGKLGVVLDSSNAVRVPREVHQSCGSWPGDGEHGSLLSWVGFDALRRFKVLPFDAGCFSGLRREMLLEQDPGLDRDSYIPHWLLWTWAHVSDLVLLLLSATLLVHRHHHMLICFVCVCVNFRDCSKLLAFIHSRVGESKLRAVFKKYSKAERCAVALVSSPAKSPLLSSSASCSLEKSWKNISKTIQFVLDLSLIFWMCKNAFSCWEVLMNSCTRIVLVFYDIWNSWWYYYYM